jgi:hypothetical protein
MPLSATDHRRIALFSGLLNRAPISGNVPYLFGWKRQFIGVQCVGFARFWIYSWFPFQQHGRENLRAKQFSAKGQSDGPRMRWFLEKSFFSGNSRTRAYA